MQCYVYKGKRKEGAYLYICREGDFSDVPEPLLKSMGELTFALTFSLDADRKLAQADPIVVRENLEKLGFHLQMPSLNHNLLLELPNAKPKPLE